MPSTVTSAAYVTCGTPSRSASIAGTTPIEPSVDAMPQSTMSQPPILSIACASTCEVASASEPAMASSTTWTPESAPICSDLRTASAACSGPTVSTTTSPSSPGTASRIVSPSSTAYSSSSDSRPSTLVRSTVLSAASKPRLAVASGTCLTHTTIFMDCWASWSAGTTRLER